jgi:hypothetical protein
VTTTATTRRFRRVDTILWRDTGRQVLALPPGTTDVMVLTGGAALLWRLLDSELELAEIVAAISEGAEAPDPDLIAACLDDLARSGLVVVEGAVS